MSIVVQTLDSLTERDYVWLKTSVATYMHRGDLTAIIPDLIARAELRINRELRISAMEEALAVQTVDGLAALPVDYLELKHAYLDGETGRLERTSPGWIQNNYGDDGYTGKPLFIAREGANFIFGPTPDTEYLLKGIYYARFTPLSVSNLANWLTQYAFDLLLFGALVEARDFVGDMEKVMRWEAKFQETKALIIAEDAREDFSGSPLTIRAC